ncbi:MAG: MFS transporter [Bacillota bacterium]|nr:MFS transporter [Bacillota bacterium]
MERIDEKISKNRWIILITVVMCTFMACLDSSIVNVALPVMSNKLSVSMASIEWVVTSYLIIISATILIFGRLGDMIGKTKVFKFGIITFTIGSLLCGMSNSLLVLVIARVIQAVGAAGTMSTSQGIITHVFPQNERGKALGINGTFVALGAMVGPALGGLIIAAFSWKYIFLINVPIGLIVFAAGMKTLPKSSSKVDEKLDGKGAVLFTVAIVALFGALIQGQVIGFTKAPIILGFVISVIAFISFLVVEKREKAPLLQLSIFENKLFSISIFCGFLSFIAISSFSIIQPFYLQDTLKLNSAVAGFFLMISPIVLAVTAPISGHLSDKIGSEVLTFLGLIFTSVGLLLMATLNEHSNLLVMTIYIAIMTIGSGLFQSPNNSLVMSTVSRDKLGIAGSVNALIRNLGMVVGIAMATTLLYNRMSAKVGYHVINYVAGRDDVFVYGMRVVNIVSAIICIVGAVITAGRLAKSRASEKAETEAA